MIAGFIMIASSAYTQEVLSIEQVLNKVEENNPALKAYETRIKGQDARVQGAKAWMAPMIGAGTFMTPYPGTELMPDADKGSFMVSVEQDIPNPSKTRAKGEYLAAQSDITKAERLVRYNQLRFQARQLYYDLIIAYRKIRLQNENQQIMKNMKKLAEIRYPYNQGSLNQVFKAEGRAYESENMILMTEGEIWSKKIALNALMNRSSDTAFEPDTALHVNFKVAGADSSYFASSRSDITQMDRSIKAMQLNIEQMRKEARPDFRIRFDHMKNYSGMMPAQFTAMAMISVPIAPWSSGMYKSEVKSMNFEIEAMRQQRSSMLTEMAGMTKAMETELLTMQKQLVNYEKKILPALTKSLNTSMLSYQENKLDLGAVIDAWEAKNMVQMNYLDQLQKYYQMIAEYEKSIEK
ncbi:outer membrane protein TolC [Arcticibacter tournemirensis]|nr:outer membrane protein TolC [Arcticibacter tournemirensis]